MRCTNFSTPLNRTQIYILLFIMQEVQAGDILDCNQYRAFWINWSESLYQVGRGPRFGESVLMETTVPENARISAIAMDTLAQTAGKFELSYMEGTLLPLCVLLNCRNCRILTQYKSLTLIYLYFNTMQTYLSWFMYHYSHI